MNKELRILYIYDEYSPGIALKSFKEVKAILSALSHAAHRANADIIEVLGSEEELLLNYIVEFSPQVLHFSGHGIVPEGSDGEVFEFSSALLQEIKARVKCVVLEACQSSYPLTDLVRHAPFTILIPEQYGDMETIEFITAFYRGLAFGKDVNTAFQLAKSALSLHSESDDSFPVLIPRCGKYKFCIEGDKVGVIGDNTHIKGGIHFDQHAQMIQTQINAQGDFLHYQYHDSPVIDQGIRIDREAAYAIATIIDSGASNTLHLHCSTTLLAGISFIIPDHFKSSVILLPADKDRFDFQIAVRAEDMDIDPSWMQPYTFICDKDSPLIKFTLTPRVPGVKQICVDYYYERHWLAKIEFEVEVVAAETPEPVINSR